MTTERDPFERDELVTETYRELGVEKAPEHLNQSILRMASGSSKQIGGGQFLFAAWMKPLAWATTIGLSLAIVLELSQVPTAAVRSDIVPAAVESIREEAKLQDASVLDKAESPARVQSRPILQAISEDELGRSVASDADVEVFSRETKGKIDAIAAPAQLSSSPAAAPAAEKPASLQSTARKRVADVPTENESIASFAILAEQKESDIAESCEAAVRLSADEWLLCIANLRQSGAEEAADLEYEAFILEYPNENRDLEPNK
jgi:hypothetical protein